MSHRDFDALVMHYCEDRSLVGEGVIAEGVDLFDVDPSVEAAAFGAEDDHSGLWVTPCSEQLVGEFVPGGDIEGVHRWVVHDHFGDAWFCSCGHDWHRCSFVAANGTRDATLLGIRRPRVKPSIVLGWHHGCNRRRRRTLEYR